MIPEIQIGGDPSNDGPPTRRANNEDPLLDEALPRPYCEENVRVQWLVTLTELLREESWLGPDVNLQELAARTLNYTWAEIKTVVEDAKTFAAVRSLLNRPVVENSFKVTMDDFMKSLTTVNPELGKRRPNGMVSCGDRHKRIYERAMLLVEQVKGSTGSPLVSCLLEGPSGCGKTALAATVGINSGFPCVQFVSAETMIGLHQREKCARIERVFEDACKHSLGIVILDDLELLLENTATEDQCWESIYWTLLNLLKRRPPEGKRLLVIGTTSKLDSLAVRNSFFPTYHVPTLKTDEVKEVLEQLNVFSEDDVHAAAEALNDMPLKKIYMLLEMARVERDGAGRETINIADFYDCLQDSVRYGRG